MRFLMLLLLAVTLHATAAATVTEPADSAATVTDSKPVTIRPYDYFFRYLPVAAETAAGVVELDKIFGDPSVINTVVLAGMNYLSPFDDNSIKSTEFPRDNERPIFVWKFPEPDECPDCLYVAFVPSGDKIRCLFLEKSVLVPWVIGTMNEGSHMSYSELLVTPADAAAFLDALREKKLIE